MKKSVIFDFNRTLYNPDSNTLAKKTRWVLHILRRRGFSLFLVSRAAPSRYELIKHLGLETYFAKVVLAREKNLRLFERLTPAASVDRASSFVVGDRVRHEILIGNALGLHTIWFSSGLFASQKPRNKAEQPIHTVYELSEVLSIIRQKNLS